MEKNEKTFFEKIVNHVPGGYGSAQLPKSAGNKCGLRIGRRKHCRY